MPKRFQNFKEDYEYRKIVGILDSCNLNDEGKIKAEVTIYLIG